MDIDTELATKNVFRRRCPTRAVCCPIHEKKMCVRYVQPPRPESFRPLRCYESPTHPLQSESIYHLSYRNVDAKGARPPAANFRGNITLPDAPLEDSTTMNLSYPWNYQAPPKPFRPESGYYGPIAPLQEMTTQRHDFPAKPIDRVDDFRPIQNLLPVCAKMEDRTITMESFLPTGKPEPSHSYKPNRAYEPPTEPFEKDTITQTSFMPPEMPEREIYPWMVRGVYQAPEPAMVDDTVYNGSFLAPGKFEKCLSEPQITAEICYCKFPKADEDL